MLKPDNYFKKHSIFFPAKDRAKARKLFRRAIRDYYVMQRKYVFDPETQERVQSILYGATIKHQKKQRRKVKLIFKGRETAGKPPRLEIKVLISRLFILWGQYASTKPTFSWKLKASTPTDFEDFLSDLLPRIGARDVRRYVEAHWQDRKVKIYVV
jgi:hypothetical protein